MLRSRLQLALVVALVVAAAAATGLVLGSMRNSATSSAVAVSEQRQGPFHGSMLPEGIAGMRAHEFRLTDPRLGRQFGTADVAGKPYVVTFLYTQCPDVCPLIGEELRRTLELLGGSADDVAVLAVSADPKGDTPARVLKWLERHREPRNFHYLIGTRRELRPIWDAYYAAPQPEDSERSAHSASVWLIDGRGRIRTKYSAGVPFEPKDLARDYLYLLDEQ